MSNINKIRNTASLLDIYKIDLIQNHGIYFEEFGDSALGVLAEDTNYMIRNIAKNKEITIREIESNLEQLKDIVRAYW